jgi:formylglycine-generating enzyme required for sulfatase activity
MHRPVEQVSWREAMEFCLRLRRHTSREYTLPSEEQWEYACRAGTTTPFSFGMILTTAIANYDGNYFEQNAPKGLDRQETTTVNSFPANRWGLHDMHGNVWEWCVNRGENDDTRMIRGGSWGDGPVYCRSTIRQAITQTTKSDRLGFRLCVPAPGYSAERRQGRLQHLQLQHYGATIQLNLIMAEEEEWRSEIQRLARYSPDVIMNDQSAKESQPALERKARDPEKRHPELISLTTTGARCTSEKNIQRIIRDPITVTGFQEELDLGFSITMLQIPEGEFMMGSEERGVILSMYEERCDHDKPRHRVQLQSFFLGQYPVTQMQWKIVAEWPMVKRELNPAPSDCWAPNRPVTCVSWHEAIEFCERLSRKTHRNYTLPSEAQWEYACRAGTSTTFAFGDTLTPELANYSLGDIRQNYFLLRELAKIAPSRIDLTCLANHYWPETTRVGIFPSNLWGLHDMHGNVFEWCLDYWNPDYKNAPSDGSAWISSGDSTSRVRRGGCWDHGVESTSSAHRSWRSTGVVDRNTGFRLCLAPGSLIS